MTDLKTLSDSTLLSSLKILVKKEWQLTGNIISHFDEVERRKLYSDVGYKSLFEYCVKELSYSEDQAYRRIQAMRLSKRVPKVREQIDSGVLSLTNANLLSGFLKEVNLPKKEAEQIVDRVSGSTKRDCQNILSTIREGMGISSALPKRPVIRHESSKRVRLSVSLTQKTMKKIEDIKGMLGHKKLDLSEIIELMADTLIEKKKAEYVPLKKGKSEGSGRYIPKVVKDEALRRANHSCEICSSTFALQFDHIIPFAAGGKSNSENIRVLCRNCNLREAIKFFGIDKISSIGRIC